MGSNQNKEEDYSKQCDDKENRMEKYYQAVERFLEKMNSTVDSPYNLLPHKRMARLCERFPLFITSYIIKLSRFGGN